MLAEPKPVHWIPDTRKYTYDKHGTRVPVQNHPIHVRYPAQCNKGLWAGEGIVVCYAKKEVKKPRDIFSPRIPKWYNPLVVNRVLYSEILDRWLTIPCTNRAMDLIDDAFGLDHYILKTSERDLNSKLGMDLKREMLVALAKKSLYPNDLEKREKIYNRYKQYEIPLEEAEWVGLSISEALDKARRLEEARPVVPLKTILTEQFIKDYQEMLKKPSDPEKRQAEEEDEEDEGSRRRKPSREKSFSSVGVMDTFKNWVSGTPEDLHKK